MNSDREEKEVEDKHKNSQDDDENTVPPHKGATINLRVVGQDGSEVFFRIREHATLGRLIDAYCDRRSIARSAVRFMFDGERVTDEMTPASLDMEENDVIDAMLQQVGG